MLAEGAFVGRWQELSLLDGLRARLDEHGSAVLLLQPLLAGLPALTDRIAPRPQSSARE